ncbi:MAG: NAD(+)/NADH kinase [Nitrospirales bacterium]|nr:NAD(+)/NADH kinase [Nitrospirales bacterium]
MNTIGILSKPHLSNIESDLTQLVKWLKDRGKEVLLDLHLGETLPKSESTSRNRIAMEADLLIVLGGDGSMLGAARLVEQRSLPILGVNMGGLGFLTETTIDDLYGSLEKVFAGGYYLDQRLMLQVTIYHQGRRMSEATVLNDVVIGKGHLARMISTQISIDKTFMTNIRGDGLIIATPTGSTAYSLSAGGPILDPSLDVLLINPICPHTLSHRPFLTPSRVSIEVALTSHNKAVATLDGQIGIEMNPGDTVEICPSEHRAQLIRFPDRSYYDVLRNKLKWGDG